MLELPEIARLAVQGQKELAGRQIASVAFGDKPHKFLFKNKDDGEIARLLAGKTIREVWADAKWLHLRCEPGVVFSFNEMGGQIRFVEAGSPLPTKAHFV
ncbi:MAG TPA: DNA-formamidopyrimidine glycosylase family protein, partial [Fimbriimonas sp.]